MEACRAAQHARAKRATWSASGVLTQECAAMLHMIMSISIAQSWGLPPLAAGLAAIGQRTCSRWEIAAGWVWHAAPWCTSDAQPKHSAAP
eukprot:scaffold324308_cov53-Tisochrysis_lutea.AAC.1